MNIDSDNQLTGQVIGCAIEVHRELGPGLDELAYEEALSAKLTRTGLHNVRQLPLPLTYKGLQLDCGYRLDLLVEGRLPVELKSVERMQPIFEAQLLTYQRIGDFPLGLLLNFDVAALKDGIQRKACTIPRGARTEPIPASARDGYDALSADILESAIEVHRHLGPGLLRSAYETCLCQELRERRIPFAQRKPLTLTSDGAALRTPAELPLLVGGTVPVFCLSVGELTPLHVARLLGRLRQGDWPYGFLLNFNTPLLLDGVRRVTR
jgi:GxxExxY protein